MMSKMMGVWLVVLLTAGMAHAQEETLVGSGFHSGGYGGPLWKVGSVKGESALFTGGRGAWIINHRFAIGGGGASMISDVNANLTTTGKDQFLRMETGGFEMEYIHDSDKLIHWTIHVMIGGGVVRLKEHNPDVEIASDHMYIIEPSANMDVNIAEWFRLGIGVSYRIVMGLNLPPITNDDMSGPAAGMVLKFGSF